MTKKRRTGLMIGLAVACIAVLCVAGACNGTAKEERIAHRVIVTITTTAATSHPTEIATTALPTTTAPVTMTAKTTMKPQITATITCSTTEQGICEMPTSTTAEQTTAADTTVPPTTTTTPATTTAHAPAEPYNGQTSGDYIYVNGFGWVFNEGGGGEGSVNYEMYCNGNKIGYFG